MQSSGISLTAYLGCFDVRFYSFVQWFVVADLARKTQYYFLSLDFSSLFLCCRYSGRLWGGWLTFVGSFSDPRESFSHPSANLATFFK